ncbi:MAG TPA: MBL fold metallo-hydrolase [Pseudogracilibacillus sp.]|nr:MBL fold metallo-hydrolase [Pseudogracilibacillus sp.]
MTDKRSILILVLLTMTFVIVACGKKPVNEVNPDILFNTEEHEGQLTVHFFDLIAPDRYEKTGESILVTTPKGKTILIDAGKPMVGELLNDYLNALEIDTIDYAMPSHPHFDHIGGYLTIFEEKEVKEIKQINLPHEESKHYVQYADLIEEKNIPVSYIEEGDVIEIEEDVTLEVYNPMAGLSPETYSFGTLSAGIINDVSAVMKLTYKDTTFLFTGDIYRGVENSLVNKYEEELDVDVLVAPHHGLGTSSSDEFIEATKPDITIFPTNVLFDLTIVNKYKDAESDVYVTKFDGNIMLMSNGKKIDVYREHEEDVDTDDPNEVENNEEV